MIGLESVLWFAVTVAVACVGGLLGRKLKMPAGLLAGAMIAAAAFQVLTEKGVFYTSVRVGLQILSGALVGSRIGINELKNMRRLVWSLAALIVSLMALNITFALLILLVSPLNPATALFATAPGGASDMGIICTDFGGDAGIVAILQVSRLILIYLFIPPVIRYFDRREARLHPDAAQRRHSEQLLEASALGTGKTQFVCMVLCAAAGGLMLHFLGVSAGAMIGGMIGSGIFCVSKGRQKYPDQLKIALQLLSGAYIGCRIDRATVSRLDELLLPLLIMLAGIFAFTFATSAILRKVSKLDRSTSMLASCPGGIQEMSLLSEELDADTPTVAVLHTARLVFVILFFPYMIQLVLSLLSLTGLS